MCAASDSRRARRARMGVSRPQPHEHNDHEQATSAAPGVEAAASDISAETAEAAAALLLLSCDDRRHDNANNEESAGEELGSEDSDTESEDSGHELPESYAQIGYRQIDEDEDSGSFSLGSHDTDQEPMLPANYGAGDDADDEGESDSGSDNSAQAMADASDDDAEAGGWYDENLQTYTHPDGRVETWYPQPSGWNTLNRDHSGTAIIERDEPSSASSDDEEASSTSRTVAVTDENELSIAMAMTASDNLPPSTATCTCTPDHHDSTPTFSISAGAWTYPGPSTYDTTWSTTPFTIPAKPRTAATSSPAAPTSSPSSPRFRNLSRQFTVPACDVHYPISGLAHNTTPFTLGSRFLKTVSPSGDTSYTDQAHSLRLIEHDTTTSPSGATSYTAQPHSNPLRRMSLHAPPHTYLSTPSIRKLNAWLTTFRRQRGFPPVTGAAHWGGAAHWRTEELDAVIKSMARMLAEDGGYCVERVREEAVPGRTRAAVVRAIRRYGLVGVAGRKAEEERGGGGESDSDKPVFSPLRRSLRFEVEEGVEEDSGAMGEVGGEDGEMDVERRSRKKARRVEAGEAGGKGKGKVHG